MIYCIVRSDGRGVSKCIVQKEMSCKEDKIRARGTLKIAHPKDDSIIDGLLSYPRLNIIDEYNYNMKNVDIADHLRGSCRSDHSVKKRKCKNAMQKCERV